MAITEAMAAMYPAPVNSDVVTPTRAPKVLPTKVMKPPVEGITLVNSESELPRKAIAMPATKMVSGEARPAV